MATPKKMPSGRWRVLAYGGKDSKGKAIRKSITADSKKECMLLAAQYENGIREKEKRGITVREVMQTYIDSKSNILSPSTIQGYRRMLKNRFEGILNVPVDELTQIMIQAEINREAEKNKPKTLRNTVGLLSAALKSYDPSLHFNYTLPQKIKPKINVPTKEEVEHILELSERKPELYLAVLIASNMGLRRSEICGLTWDNINLTFRKITVNQAKVQNDKDEYVIKSTKTYSGTRVLDIPDRIYDELVKVEDKTGFLIKASPTAISRAYNYLQYKYDVKCRFHDLRHYYASVMLMLGIPDKYAMERMGHATSNMLKNVYQHTFEQKQMDISNQLNDYFNDVPTKKSAHKSAHEKTEPLKILGS